LTCCKVGWSGSGWGKVNKWVGAGREKRRKGMRERSTGREGGGREEGGRNEGGRRKERADEERTLNPKP